MSNMLYVPLRTTEHVQLIARLSECIEDVYNQHPEKFRRDIEAFDSLRTAIVAPASVDPLVDYFTQLSTIAPKFPYDCGIEFIWYNTLGYATRAAVTNTSMQFERINVMYNIAAFYTYRGHQANRNSPDGLKQAFQNYQLAAGSFRYLIDEVIREFKESLPLGLEPATLECLYWISLAQAQESFWQKAVADGLKNMSIAKMSLQVSDCYNESLEHASKSPSIRSEWVDHLFCKKQHFQAASQYRLALDCLDKGKYGEEVGRLQACVAACKEGLTSKYVTEAVSNDIKGLHNKAQEDLKRAAKDNDLMYLQMVPNILPEVAVGSLIAKPLTPNVNQQPTSPLFHDLLPYALYQASKAYTQKLEEYLNKNIVAEAEKLTQILHEELIKRNLPGSLSAIEQPQGIPHDILLKSQEMRANGGVEYLKRSMNDVLISSKRCQTLLDESQQVLKKEAAEDMELRHRYGSAWDRQPSEISGASLLEKYEKMAGYLSAASTSDVHVREKFEQAEQTMTILEKGRASIEPFIPNSSSIEFGRPLQRCVRSIRLLLSKMKIVEANRDQYIASLKFMLANLDMTDEFKRYYQKNIIADNPYAAVEASSFDPAYQAVLQKFQKDFVWLRDQEGDQKQLVEEIEKEMITFGDLSDTDRSIIERQTAIQYLEVAYFKFSEIRGNLEEGLSFYNPFLQQVNGFLQSCKQFVHDKRIEAANMEKALAQGRTLATPISAVESSVSEHSDIAAPVARHPGAWTE